MKNKSILKSKTFYLGIITAFAPLFPGVSEYVSSNVAQIGMIWGVATMLLRLITKDKIVLIE